MRSETILVCDDEDRLRKSLSRYLSAQGFEVLEAQSGEEALEVLGTKRSVSLLVLDFVMGGLDGLQVLSRLREAGNGLPVLLLTGNATVDVAVRATKLGCVNIVQKPFRMTELLKQIEEVLLLQQPKEEEEEQAKYDHMLGRSKAMQGLFQKLKQVEKVDVPTLLISGESGTGKELVAQAIHRQGKRAAGPFIEIDCSTVPESLLESTLFGHERGAFTDAKSQRRGLFEIAEDGILFLDEIGELTLTAQVKLLRALEARTFRRVGGSQNIALTAGVVTATNRNLLQEIEGGRFRQDLYYRLASLQIITPPLRERTEDIGLLAAHFLSEFCKRYQKPPKRLLADAMECLLLYPWPGNVREMRNLMEQLVVFAEPTQISRDELPVVLRRVGERDVGGSKEGVVGQQGKWTLPEEGLSLDELERDLMDQALIRTQQNQSAAAKLLGLPRHSFRTLMKRFNRL
jgi:two-component system, NtrC family, response regulator AtoC